MKRLILLAAMLIPALGGAAGEPLGWKIKGNFRPGMSGGHVVLEINDRQIASSALADQATLSGAYQGYDVTVYCAAMDPRTGLVACGVFADGQRLKTLYFNPRLSR
ncbi:MAG: hypothetical protein ACE5H7_12325 [Acidiferrobacterales bacterium]